MKIPDILASIGQIAAEISLAEHLSGHTNVTIDDISKSYNLVTNGITAVEAGKALSTLVFTETDAGIPRKIKLYAVLEGGNADQVISSTLV